MKNLRPRLQEVELDEETTAVLVSLLSMFSMLLVLGATSAFIFLAVLLVAAKVSHYLIWVRGGGPSGVRQSAKSWSRRGDHAG